MPEQKKQKKRPTFRSTRYAGFLQSLLITLAGKTPPRSVCAYIVNSLLGLSSMDLDPAPAAAAVAAAAELPPPPAAAGSPPLDAAGAADFIDLLARRCLRLSPRGQMT